MVRNKRLSFDERKQQIKRAAARIFTEKGFENTTMEDLVKETGLSKGGLYHYYKNTTGILYDIMLDGIVYRNNVIAQSIADGRQWSIEFLAEELAKKAVDANELMPVYVELLLAKKRNSRLEEVYRQLEHTTFELFETQHINTTSFNLTSNQVAFMSFFVNAIILSANVLKAHELVQDNQDLIKEMFLFILKQGNLENSTSRAERAHAQQPHPPQPHQRKQHQRKQHHATPSPSTKERL